MSTTKNEIRPGTMASHLFPGKTHFAVEFAANEGLNPSIYCGEGTPENKLDINEGN